MATIEAIYEKGAFNPDRPILCWPRGRGVELTIVEKPSDVPTNGALTRNPSQQILADLLKIAAEATPSDEATDVARDHDSYLYGV